MEEDPLTSGNQIQENITLGLTSKNLQSIFTQSGSLSPILLHLHFMELILDG